MSATAFSTYVAQSSVFIISRALLFFASRRYLLHHIYHDLQDLSPKTHSAPGTPAVVFDADGVELNTLPAPTTSPNVVNTPRKRLFHSFLSRTLFSLCFSESCILFILLVCQGLDMFNPMVRLLHWNISLYFLIISIVLVIPVSYSLVLSNSSNAPGVPSSHHNVFSASLALYLIPNILTLLALSYVPLPDGMPTHTIMASTLSRLTVIGTVIIGALSGFAAIDTAWDFFPVFSKQSRSHPTDDEVRNAESGLGRVREDLVRRQKELRTLEESKNPEAHSSHWLYRALPSFSGNSEASSLAQEISGLQALEYEMSRNLETLKQRQASAKFSKTVAGRLFNWGGRLFAMYCVYRIFSVRASTSTNADVVSLVLAHLFSFLPFVHVAQGRVAVISRQISLILVGVIILSSIRRILQGVARVLRVTSRSLGASLMMLMLAQVMGIYLLSTLIQLRTSFPPPPARPDTSATSETLFATLPEYQFFGTLFDGTFLLSAGVAAAARWFGDKVASAS
ncbi:Abscisic acid G-protein coupled receptor-domain-containing protein [Epithele typhae]|uniref:Abscisic acid G-protein coupled receptor-domain-containing protein n=1 Tax=Epithele typhae TaxID=378194 RepID=UPI002007F317|nr:Abscisic acid G-protein coupled receptor-domain-containing protein [Epithele typhae]KAH9931624.1 Abscisic acid G-protein coupled receptor-domain-containing protein [Epithele typhae]